MKIEPSPRPAIQIYLENEEAEKLREYLQICFEKDIPFGDKNFIMNLIDKMHLILERYK